MARYKVLQTFDARHESFAVGTITDFVQWKPTAATFQHSNLPLNGMEPAMKAAEQARLDDIVHFIRTGHLEDLDRDEVSADVVAARGVTPEVIAAALRLVRIDWEQRTKVIPGTKGQTLDDLMGERDVSVRLVVDPGLQPLYATIIKADEDEKVFGAQVPFEADIRWYAMDALDVATRTFNGPGTKDSRDAAPAAPQSASDHS